MLFRDPQTYKKVMWKRLKALFRISLRIALTHISDSRDFFCKFLAVAAPGRADAPISKKYAQPSPFQMH